MKKTVLLSVMVFGGLALLGCNVNLHEMSKAQASELKPMPQSWFGILPCADCAGIETSLFLDRSGHWQMKQHYRDAKTPAEFISQGSWARTADKLVLTEDNGSKTYFQVKKDSLEMTRKDGQTSASGLPYTLRPARHNKDGEGLGY